MGPPGDGKRPCQLEGVKGISFVVVGVCVCVCGKGEGYMGNKEWGYIYIYTRDCWLGVFFALCVLGMFWVLVGPGGSQAASSREWQEDSLGWQTISDPCWGGGRKPPPKRQIN